MSEISTKDIFHGAYLLASGGKLIDSRLVKEKQVMFVIEGEGLEEHDLSYRSGHALINPLQLRESLNLLRDLIFEKLRKERKNYGSSKYPTENRPMERSNV